LEYTWAAKKERQLLETSKKEYVAEHLKEHINRGNFNQRKNRINDNIEMTPKSKV